MAEQSLLSNVVCAHQRLVTKYDAIHCERESDTGRAYALLDREMNYCSFQNRT